MLSNTWQALIIKQIFISAKNGNVMLTNFSIFGIYLFVTPIYDVYTHIDIHI